MDEQRKYSEFKFNLLGNIGKVLINLWFITIKIEVKNFGNVRHIIESNRLIFATWHSRMLIFSYLYKGANGAVLVSQSKDGNIASKILEKMGNEAFRGSTTRGGGRALVKLIKALKEKNRISLITTDGPQGPRFKVQPGIIALAKKTGYPILPATYSGKRIKIFSSWDRFILPYPFTTCRVSYGRPVYIPKDAGKGEEKEYLESVEKELQQLTFNGDSYFGHRIL